jgi:HlyD family secretion protein
MTAKIKKWVTLGGVLLIAGAAGTYIWIKQHPKDKGLISGNGRVEATEIDVAAKLAGRVIKVFAKEGDSVQAGQLLVQMQIGVLQAQLEEANAQHQRAVHTTASAQAQVALRQSDKAAAEAVVLQREAELDAAQRRLARSETLSKEGAATRQELDDDRARQRSFNAAVTAAKAQVAAAQSAIDAARAEVVAAESAIAAAKATIDRIQADINDSSLKAPRDGRVQYRIAEEGEVLGQGGKAINLVDLNDVYMTFFLPERAAGQVAIGDEARLILDTAPQWVIPARVSFVASTAQFTPKTVETAAERQKLMFRVKAHIDRELLQKHVKYVKTGLPGVAWLKLDPQAQWPARLTPNLPDVLLPEPETKAGPLGIGSLPRS